MQASVNALSNRAAELEAAITKAVAENEVKRSSAAVGRPAEPSAVAEPMIEEEDPLLQKFRELEGK